MGATFKRCSLCGKEWLTRADFVNDATIHFDGPQPNRRKTLIGRWKNGLLIYTHRIDECGTTLAVEPPAIAEEAVLG